MSLSIETLDHMVAWKNSAPLTAQLETVLGAIEVLALEAPVDATYRAIRNRLGQAGQSMGGNDLWIALGACGRDRP